MTRFLIINGGKAFGHSAGELNRTLADFAASTLKDFQFEVETTFVDGGYDVEAEVEKYLRADVVIYQMPGWWMGAPWTLKKYMDEVFTAGHGRLYASDGRSRSDSNLKYGSGGLIQGKQYMLSLTWNAPMEAFTDPAQFFEGVGVDGVYLPFHKANQFLGMSPLPTFICNDVIKAPAVAADIDRYYAHLATQFAPARHA